MSYDAIIGRVHTYNDSLDDIAADIDRALSYLPEGEEGSDLERAIHVLVNCAAELRTAQKTIAQVLGNPL